jgi:hypothetical protein
VRRFVDTYFASPRVAAQMEAEGQIVTDFPPSRPSDTYYKTHLCTDAQLRDAESLAMHDGNLEFAGRIPFYRHARFGCSNNACSSSSASTLAPPTRSHSLASSSVRPTPPAARQTVIGHSGRLRAVCQYA